MSTTALRVAIVGGGIGGAAAANALLQRGIEVQVFEQASALTEVGAGVGIGPNGIRTLRRLGFGEALTRRGALWTDPRFYRADGTFIAPMWPPDQDVEFYGMHRADLLGMLVDRLPDEVVKTGRRCVGFEQDDEQATVFFANGECATADVVVGADGIHSALQPYVVEPSAPTSSGSMAYRGIISAASVDWPDGAMRNFLGPNRRFMIYPVRAGELLNYVGFVPMDQEIKESWSAAGDPAALSAEFAGWDLMVQEVLGQVKTCFRWGLYDREPLRRWSSGRLTLLGDAAHPMYPRGSNGAAQAIIDARSLADRLAEDGDPRAALGAYEAARSGPTARVVLANREQPPDHLIGRVEELVGDRPFDDLDRYISQTDLQRLSDDYKRIAGFALSDVTSSGL